MITDEDIERLLDDAARAIEVPADGPDRILAAAEVAPARPTGRLRLRLPRSARAIVATAAVVVLAVVASAVALGATSGQKPASRTTLSAPSGPGQRALTYGPAQPGQAKVTSGTSPLGSDSTAATGAGSASVAGPVAAPPAAAAPAPSTTVPDVIGSQVIKTGTMTVRVPRGQVSNAMDQLITIGVGLGGIVSNSNSELAGPDPTAEVTLRIPSRWFETAVSRVGKLGALQSEGLSGQDVTSQYVDLQGRIAALQTSRSTYLTILSKATSIGDILAVQQQIDGIQQQLEQLQGQQRVLNDQIQYATLDVTLSQRASAPPGPPSGVHKAASHAVHDFVVGFEDIVGALGALLLALLIAAVVIAGLRISWRYARRSLV